MKVRMQTQLGLLMFLALLAGLILAAWDGRVYPQPLHVANAIYDATSTPVQDWPQLGRDAQRSNYTPLQVDPPYCYIWKWYEAPFARRPAPGGGSDVPRAGKDDVKTNF